MFAEYAKAEAALDRNQPIVSPWLKDRLARELIDYSEGIINLGNIRPINWELAKEDFIIFTQRPKTFEARLVRSFTERYGVSSTRLNPHLVRMLGYYTIGALEALEAETLDQSLQQIEKMESDIFQYNNPDGVNPFAVRMSKQFPDETPRQWRAQILDVILTSSQTEISTRGLVRAQQIEEVSNMSVKPLTPLGEIMPNGERRLRSISEAPDR